MRTHARIPIVRGWGMPLLASFAAVVFIGTPGELQAQLLKHIKEKVVEHTTKKATEHAAKAESTVVKRTDMATDSALTKSDRGLTFSMDRAGAALDSGLNRSERTVASLFGGAGIGGEELAAQLASGRAVLRDVAFGVSTAELLPASEPVLKRLAAALRSASGTYLIEGHVDASGDATTDQRLSELRSVAVKVKLTALGIPESRLFVMGLGSTRPLVPGAATSARIEVAKMQ